MVATIQKQVVNQMVMSRRQAEALEWADSSERVLGAYGSIRSGKTHSVPIGFMAHTQRLPKPYLHAITGRKLRQVEVELLPHIRNFAACFGLHYDYHRGDRILTVGSQRYLCLAANDIRSEDSLTGFTLHSALCDETTLYPGDFLTILFGRLTYSDSKLFMLGNPAGPNHPVKKDWIDSGDVQTYLQFRLDDNPSLSDEYKGAVRRKYTGALRRRLIDGEWSAAEGVIWSQFTRQMPQIPDSAEILVPVDVGMAHSRTAFLVMIRLSVAQWHVRQCHLMDSAYTSEDSTAPRLGDLMATTARIVKSYGGKRRCKMVVDASSVGYPYYLELIKNGYRVIRADKWSVMEGLQRTDEKLSDGSLTIDEEDCGELVDDINSFCWAKDKDEPSYTDGTYDPCDALRYGAVAAFGRRDYGIQQVRV